MAFLHGAEVIEQSSGTRPINPVRSGVIGLVGTAPKGATNTLTVITTPRQAIETFGEQVPGFTIPKALDSIFAQGGARVLVVNVFDADDHTTTVADESNDVAAGVFSLANAPVGAVVITSDDGITSYVDGTDYSIDAFGNVRILDTTAIPNGTTLLTDYVYLDPTAITAAVVNGSASVPRTGIELLDEAESNLGYAAKILISPTYNELAAVATKLLAKATKYRGVTIFDAPAATDLAAAIASRGAASTVPTFQTSNKRAVLAFPYVKAFNQLGVVEERPLSAYIAGLMAVKDNAEGYWVSPSNTQILGITGPKLLLTAGISDTGSNVNLLNEQGIVTVFSAYGTGYRLWGNRSSAFPVETTSDNFIAVQRVKDVLNASVEQAMLPFIDRPINQALIASIRETVNAFIRTLVGRGALIDGECTYNPDDNPSSEIAAGRLVFDIAFAAPTPAERITFKSYLDQSLLGALA